jgi:hypothetical protein
MDHLPRLSGRNDDPVDEAAQLCPQRQDPESSHTAITALRNLAHDVLANPAHPMIREVTIALQPPRQL